VAAGGAAAAPAVRIEGRCPECGQVLGGLALEEPLLYACAHPGCGAGPLRLRGYGEHCCETGHAPSALEARCGCCGRARWLRGAAAAAALEADWRPRWEHLKARRAAGLARAIASLTSSAEATSTATGTESDAP
jgi:hypothetical protein